MREMLAFPAVKGLYSQATTPELRKAPLWLRTCPNSSTVPVRVNVTADTALTSTVCSIVTKFGAEARNWKEAGHSVRFTTPVDPVVPWATGWTRPVGFVDWYAATVAPWMGEPPSCTVTASDLAGVP